MQKRSHKTTKVAVTRVQDAFQSLFFRDTRVPKCVCRWGSAPEPTEEAYIIRYFNAEHNYRHVATMQNIPHNIIHDFRRREKLPDTMSLVTLLVSFNCLVEIVKIIF